MATKMTREEAINKVRQMCLPKETMEILQALAPELAESEDERIRKELKEAFEAYDIESTWNGIPIRSIFAWLEKQKEQKPAEWSEEDEKIITALTKALIGSDSAEKIMLFDGVTIEMVSNWLKSLRPSWKPSEEHLSALLAVFNDPNNIGSQTCQLALTDLYEQLKKL